MSKPFWISPTFRQNQQCHRYFRPHLAAPSSSYALIFIKPKSNKRAMSMSQLGTQMLISSDSLGDKQERNA